jgi:hypothetical protein
VFEFRAFCTLRVVCIPLTLGGQRTVLGFRKVRSLPFRLRVGHLLQKTKNKKQKTPLAPVLTKKHINLFQVKIKCPQPAANNFCVFNTGNLIR